VKNEKVEYLGCDVVTILYVGWVGLGRRGLGWRLDISDACTGIEVAIPFRDSCEMGDLVIENLGDHTPVLDGGAG
jgi:hypothetical protein